MSPNLYGEFVYTVDRSMLFKNLVEIWVKPDSVKKLQAENAYLTTVSAPKSTSN